MRSLPVIVGFGGINAAGRASFHHAFLRLVYESLPPAEQDKVRRSLARLMNIAPDTAPDAVEAEILGHTLVRTIEPAWYDPANVYRHRKIEAVPCGKSLCWRMAEADLPERIPPQWTVARREGGQVEVTVTENVTFFVPDYHSDSVRAAAMLPTGFQPGSKYPSKSHPRGLQLAVYAASDAVRSVGIPWPELLARVPGDRVAVYASAAMGQLDFEGGGGLLTSALLDKHTTSRNCAFSLTQMPADFVNAYVLGNIGRTGGLIGACATFLYNLEKALLDIQLGIVDLAVVGTAEAPILPEVVESYRAMGALAEDHELLQLDGLSEGVPDHRRACRPFGPNCGFAIGESAQYLVLMSDELALERGATIFGSVPGVYIHADGAKKSITAPGIGNYLTLAKACGLAAKILGDRALRRHTFVHAHGAGTPQNRVTESHVLDRVANAFDIRDWVVATAKCFVGHSLGSASGDQTTFALGSLATGRVPGIVTVREFAADVHGERLSLCTGHRAFGPDHWQAAFVNAKGFGGNNATGLVLSAATTARLLERKHGAAALREHRVRNEAIAERQQRYEGELLAGRDEAIYGFGTNVVEGTDLRVGREEIGVPGFLLPVKLDVDNPYGSVE